MSSRRAQLRALGYLGRLGDTSTPPPDNSAPNAWTEITGIPGTDSLADLLANAFTGNLAPDQQAALTQQEQQELVQAGATPASAQAQANADVNAALTTFTGPGGFGISWTGAAPNQPGFGTALVNTAGNAIAPVTNTLGWIAQYWPWLALGGIGLYFVAKKATS